MHPLVLLSVVDHYNRVNTVRTVQRVVGVLLGSLKANKTLDIANSFAGYKKIHKKLQIEKRKIKFRSMKTKTIQILSSWTLSIWKQCLVCFTKWLREKKLLDGITLVLKCIRFVYLFWLEIKRKLTGILKANLSLLSFSKIKGTAQRHCPFKALPKRHMQPKK